MKQTHTHIHKREKNRFNSTQKQCETITFFKKKKQTHTKERKRNSNTGTIIYSKAIVTFKGSIKTLKLNYRYVSNINSPNIPTSIHQNPMEVSLSGFKAQLSYLELLRTQQLSQS